jgi:hypothetical protein
MDNNHYLLHGILKGIEDYARIVDYTEPRLSVLPFKWASINLRAKPGKENDLSNFLNKRSNSSRLITANRTPLGDGSIQLTFVTRAGQSVNEEDYFIELAREYKDSQSTPGTRDDSQRWGKVIDQIDPAKIDRSKNRSHAPRMTSRPSYNYRYGMWF